MNRGSGPIPVVVRIPEVASMRPRFMNRGSPRVRHCYAWHDTRFNEAPIHESGKCPSGSSPSRGWEGFNEAPIHESGKSA